MTEKSARLENGRPDAGMTKAGCGAGLGWNELQCRLISTRGEGTWIRRQLASKTPSENETCERQGPWVISASAASCSSRAGIIPRVWRCSSQHPSRNRYTAADHRRFRCVTALTAFPPGRPLMSPTRCLRRRFRRKAATARWNSTLHSASRRPRARAPSTSDRARTHRAAPSRSDRGDNRPQN